IGDFTQKTTKVVLNGNPFLDGALKEEVSARWRVSPFEFCTLEDFNKIKTSEDYYFLTTVKGQFRKEEEPGIQFLTLVKGGEKAENGIEEMLEIVSIPLASANSPSGREFAVLGAFLDIIQDYALGSMESDLNAYSGLGSYVSNLSRAKDKKLVFAEDDLGEGYDENNLKSLFDSSFEVMDSDDADQLIIDQADGVVVSYVVAPTNPSNGSFCYKMLIDPSTHELFFYKKHRITKKMGAVFLQEDLKRIALSRKL
ncbi:MAG: hypothetical protein ACI4TJ_05660, partial [Candidatus Cryptobacteroides sp.]